MIKIFKSHDELLATVKKYLPENPVIVEAGAFSGHDTLRMADIWPQGIIHAFEPVPDIYQQLLKHVEKRKNIFCYPVALSDTNGFAQIYVAYKKSGKITQASSLHKPDARLRWSPIIFPYTISVPTITLDTWAAQQNRDHIDFLWLDVQGHELIIMRAAEKIMKTVKALWVEVAFAHNYEHQLLYEDVIVWLGKQKFVVIGQNFDSEKKWFFGSLLCVREPEYNI
ncbi:MAG TPA: FkbM family methyltransferase [Candidatus Bathyarchaeia archaeon]|nr:FkbM family methyltransferase [Candidatus Bathyarchaeia archaeon]